MLGGASTRLSRRWSVAMTWRRDPPRARGIVAVHQFRRSWGRRGRPWPHWRLRATTGESALTERASVCQHVGRPHHALSLKLYPALHRTKKAACFQYLSGGVRISPSAPLTPQRRPRRRVRLQAGFSATPRRFGSQPKISKTTPCKVAGGSPARTLWANT
jgi:hypothetical protein